jgi:hypothetical protein
MTTTATQNKILDHIHCFKMHLIPKEYLTEEIMTSVVNGQGDTLLHRCALFSFTTSFAELPQELKSEKLLLLRNNQGNTVLHLLIGANHGNEIPSEIIFKNLHVTNKQDTNLLHKLIPTDYDIPKTWFTPKLLDTANSNGETPLQLMAHYRPQDIPNTVTKKQMLIESRDYRSALESIISKGQLTQLNKEIVVRIGLKTLLETNAKAQNKYPQETIKHIYMSTLKNIITTKLKAKTP